MRRLVVLFSAATLSLVGGVIATSAGASGGTATTEPSSAATEAPVATEAPASTAGAAETTEAAVPSTAAHPLVGAWMVENVYTIYLMSFDSDGTVQEADPTFSGVGEWEPTGPNSGAVTLLTPFSDSQGNAVIKWRYTMEVSSDGQSVSIDWEGATFRDGAPTGELWGPGTDTATRINVEPVGTPWDSATSAHTTSN
jgi:hypothetical protein